MKNKKSIIISSIFIFIGVVISIIAFTASGFSSFSYNSQYGNFNFFGPGPDDYSMHGYDDDDDSDNDFHNNMMNKMHGKNGRKGGMHRNGRSNNNKNLTRINNNEAITIEAFDKLDVDLEYSDLIIKSSENEEYKLEVNYKNKNNSIGYVLDNSSLNIVDNSGSKNPRNTVTIFIPSEKLINNLYIYSDYGEVKIDKLIAENVNIENSMSSVSITNSNLKNSEIDLDMGEFIASNTIFTNLNLDCNMGAANVSGQILGKNELSMDMGALELELYQPKDDTKIVAESDLGSITIDGSKMSGFSNEQTINPKGSNLIELESNMGEAKISFK